MRPKIVIADIVSGGLSIGFADGTNILFDTDAMWDFRTDSRNRELPHEVDSPGKRGIRISEAVKDTEKD